MKHFKFPSIFPLLFGAVFFFLGTVTTSGADDFDKEWKALLKAAQKEGEIVTFICCGAGRGVSKLIPEFEKKFGIKWTNSTGSSSQQADRILAERRVGRFNLDLWMGGARTSQVRLLPNGALTPLKPLLIHPEVLDASAWYGGGLTFLDEKDRAYVLAWAGNANTAEISYNTNLVDPKKIQSYFDFLKPEFKGKIVMRDPAMAGTSQNTAFYYLNPNLGKTFLRRLLTEMDVTITRNARQAAEWLALGKYKICMFACRQEVRRARRQGLPVSEAFPHALKEGSRIGVGGNTVFAMDQAPHPNAQKFFINWWFSREGQEFAQRTEGSQSLRLDISTKAVESHNLRKKGATYIFLEKETGFLAKMNDALAFVRKVKASVGK
ncbi:MAG: extracellular solute-binding protein [Deltaproteobacteria bacterium]|nr:extracellular solute-binding protein [Deltaproteobacteria bacterium]